MTQGGNAMTRIVSKEEWHAARIALLADEKALQAARDELAVKRRALPWREVTEDYVFESDQGMKSLGELFGDCSQLLVYHFMFHPDWEEGCKSCSFWADGYDRMVPHLKARDVSLVAISRAPLEKLLAYRDRMGWRFPWVSSAGNAFNFDFDVSFTQEQIEAGDAQHNYREYKGSIEELPGLSAFKKKDGAIYHTYSTYARGLDTFNTAYQMLDVVPDGRNEESLEYNQSWVKRRDEY